MLDYLVEVTMSIMQKQNVGNQSYLPDAQLRKLHLSGSRDTVRIRELLQNMAGGKPLLVISYAHQDERFRDEFRGALTPYELIGAVDVWDDTCIVPGQRCQDEILAKLENADIVVLLLSNDFIRSDYCFQQMKVARARDKVGECVIVPIVVRACRYDWLELGQLQVILPNGKPVKQNKDRDAAWLEVTKQLDKVIAHCKCRDPIL